MEPTVTRVFVKPATPETRLRKPVGGYLAPEGQEVTLDSFWMRRIADGDVVGTPLDVPKADNAKAASTTKKP